jgi:hypothetical protein
MYRLFGMKHLPGIVLGIIAFAESACYPQIKNPVSMAQTTPELITRKAFVAGQFYPGDPSALKNELSRLFASGSSKVVSGQVLAVISPHAGYVFSAPVAAESFMQINRDQVFDNIFLIGSSHRVSFDGASIYTQGNYETPLGIVPVNISLAGNLVHEFSFFNSRTDAQLYEHCLEVQLPFLQYWLNKPFRIVPIVLGTQNVNTCKKIAEALRPYFNEKNLFVVSTDFSHYPAYEDARIVDKKTSDAILTNNPDRLIKVLNANENAGVPGLVTSLCGWTSVLTLLYITKELPDMDYRLIDYRNSGDAQNVGDKSRVVGYCSIALFPRKSPETSHQDLPGFQLSEKDRSTLLDIARETIQSYITYGKTPGIRTEKYSAALLTHAGAFVSLYKQGKLRGCIGRFDPDIPLCKVVQEMAISSATRDYRFPKVEKDEIPELKIEISVLTPLKRIHSADEIILGKHGVYIKKGSNSGTFLPQVATSTRWTLDEFLGHCSRDKAGLGWDGWKNAELYTYEAIIVSEK